MKANSIEWLLEKNDPSVRYFTLTDILERPEDDSKVIKAKEEIMETGLVPKILAKQEHGGYWGKPEDFYIRSKYKGTVWQLIILAELGADENDKRIGKACEFILENSQDRQSGGFAYFSARDGGGDHDKILPCLTGNMVWSLVRFGYLEDPRVLKGIKWIVTYQRFDDAIEELPKGWPYDEHEKCFGRHT